MLFRILCISTSPVTYGEESFSPEYDTEEEAWAFADRVTDRFHNLGLDDYPYIYELQMKK